MAFYLVVSVGSINYEFSTPIKYIKTNIKVQYIYIQGVLLPNRQTLRGDSRHEDKHY